MSRTLHAASIANRVKRFLEDNPDEELTMGDIQAKFETTRSAAINAVVRLRHHGIEYAKVVRLKAKGIAS